MDTAFTHLLAMLGGIADPRRAEGKLYGLPHVFLFSILAVMAGANSYRAIHSFIDVHLHRLKETFELNWRELLSKVVYGLIMRRRDPGAHRADPGLDEAFRQISIADNPAAAGGVNKRRMATQKHGDLGLNGLGQQLASSSL